LAIYPSSQKVPAVKSMSTTSSIRFAVLVLSILSWACPARSLADNSEAKDLAKTASWKWSAGQLWVERSLNWIESSLSGDSKALAKESANRMVDLRGIELHETLLRLAGQLDPSIAEFLRTLEEPWSADTYQKLDSQLSSLIANGALPGWIKPDLQLAFCRNLIQNNWIDEAWSRLQTLDIDSLERSFELAFLCSSLPAFFAPKTAMRRVSQEALRTGIGDPNALCDYSQTHAHGHRAAQGKLPRRGGSVDERRGTTFGIGQDW